MALAPWVGRGCADPRPRGLHVRDKGPAPGGGGAPGGGRQQPSLASPQLASLGTRTGALGRDLLGALCYVSIVLGGPRASVPSVSSFLGWGRLQGHLSSFCAPRLWVRQRGLGPLSLSFLSGILPGPGLRELGDGACPCDLACVLAGGDLDRRAFPTWSRAPPGGRFWRMGGTSFSWGVAQGSSALRIPVRWADLPNRSCVGLNMCTGYGLYPPLEPFLSPGSLGGGERGHPSFLKICGQPKPGCQKQFALRSSREY